MSRRTRVLREFAPPFVVFLVALGVWYAVSYVLLAPDRRFLMPPPHVVVQEALLDSGNLRELLEALLLTTRVAMVGLSVSIVTGMSVAVAMAQAKWVERSLYPYAVILQAIPILAIVPLIGFWFGFDFFSRVLVCVIITIFPIIANTFFGLQSVETPYHDLFTLHRVGRLTRLWKLQFPYALPSVFTGLRISAGLSVIGAIVGDFFFRQGQPGIGILLDVYRAQLRSALLFAAVILASLLGVVVFWSVGLITRRVIGAWHESGGGFTS